MLDRLLELRVPDQITLDADELVSLLDDGVAALKERGIDVLWPRSLGRDLTAMTVLDRKQGPREQPLAKGMFGPDSLFTFNWQIAMHGEPLTEEEMDQLAGAAAPILKLRGSWTVIDPAIARKARKRLVRTVKPAQAVAAALTGVVQVDPVGRRARGRRAGRGRGFAAEGARAAPDRRHPRAARAPGRAAGRACAPTSGTASPGWPR